MLREKVNMICVQSYILHESEKSTAIRMIRWICGVKLRDKPPCVEFRQ